MPRAKAWVQALHLALVISGVSVAEMVAEMVADSPSTTTNSSTQPMSMMMMMMPESKKLEAWSAAAAVDPPELAPPVHEPPAVIQAYPNAPNMQQILPPTNYYLPPGNQYSQQAPPPPPPTTEFRSEHYAYPFEPPSFPYPVAQAPPFDTSLVPSAKHFVIVSFIGLLLLFAIIQNSIAAAKRKDALVEVLSNRKKRDLIALSNNLLFQQSVTPEVESALKEDARVRCIQRTLCYENRKILEDLGSSVGKLLAKYLTRSVQKSLKDLSPGWDRLVEDAANAGLRGEDCDVVYRDCNFGISNDSEAADDGDE